MRPKKESLSRSNQVRSIVFLTASSIAKNIAFKIHRFFEKLRLFSMWKEYWLGGQKDLINHVSHAKEKRHKVIKIKLPNNMTDDLIIKNFFFRGCNRFFPPSNQTFLILMNFAYFSRRKFFSDLYPKNNFPWKILGVTWFKKTNVAIMPLLPQKLNWCNKWEVIFRHTFCSLEFCVIASFDLAISRWITLAARLTKTVIAQVSQLSFLGIWKRRVGPTWSLAIKLAGNQMRSHHDLQGVSPSGGHLSNLGGQVLS